MRTLHDNMVDCPTCEGDGRVFRDRPAHNLSIRFQSPFKMVLEECGQCRGQGHLNITMVEYCKLLRQGKTDEEIRGPK